MGHNSQNPEDVRARAAIHDKPGEEDASLMRTERIDLKHCGRVWACIKMFSAQAVKESQTHTDRLIPKLVNPHLQTKSV